MAQHEPLLGDPLDDDGKAIVAALTPPQECNSRARECPLPCFTAGGD